MNKEQIAIELTKIYIDNIRKKGINRMDIIDYYNYFLKQLEDK
jgi:hypothetical protein